ncbi:MAG TPA: hypothetical protein VKE96_00580 [Vicinamibacterales bacterium]|nr:hypothetical protein [Vicinamibacterales bacterium]
MRDRGDWHVGDEAGVPMLSNRVRRLPCHVAETDRSEGSEGRLHDVVKAVPQWHALSNRAIRDEGYEITKKKIVLRVFVPSRRPVLLQRRQRTRT